LDKIDFTVFTDCSVRLLSINMVLQKILKQCYISPIIQDSFTFQCIDSHNIKSSFTDYRLFWQFSDSPQMLFLWSRLTVHAKAPGYLSNTKKNHCQRCQTTHVDIA